MSTTVGLGTINIVGLVGLLIIILPLLLIICVTVALGILVIKALKGGGAHGEANETRLIQDIYHGLQKMEQRVETLETILLDTERKQGDKE